jgi:hypothetical protein
LGYSTNPAVLEARRPQLAELELGRACRWRTAPDRDITRRKAYELREALYIASLHPEDYPQLALAYRGFSIHVIEPGLIEAKPRAGAELSTPQLRYDTPVQGITPFGREVSTVGKTSASEVIAAWDARIPSLDPVHFQQTTLPESELRLLWDWASSHFPKLMLLVGEGFLTLSPLEAGMDDFAWKPAVPPPAPEPEYNV